MDGMRMESKRVTLTLWYPTGIARLPWKRLLLGIAAGLLLYVPAAVAGKVWPEYGVLIGWTAGAFFMAITRPREY